MPVGFVVVPAWYLAPGVKASLGGSLYVLPGGMLAANGIFGMIVAGWVGFLGAPPI